MGSKEIKFNRKNILNLPQQPGVYLYKNNKNKVVYVGKAKNLKSRVYSYLSNNILEKTNNLISETQKLEYYLVYSELEALLLEAKLIKKYDPKYNSDLKDDKKPQYIVIHDDKYPYIGYTRKLDAKYKDIYGPFPKSGGIKKVLNNIRKIVSYPDHVPKKKVCFNYHLGLCNPCPTQIEQVKNKEKKRKLRSELLRNIRLTKNMLDGKFGLVRKTLLKDMKYYSNNQDYEKAAEIRNKLQTLHYISQPINPVGEYLDNPNLAEDLHREEADKLKATLSENGISIKQIDRIECYDVSHISGLGTAASMVTFVNGIPDKSLYRHFKINQKKKSSDIDSLREAIARRKNHFSDWGKPDLIVVDGGKSQVSVFLEILGNTDVPIVGLAKRFETIVIPIVENGSVNYSEVVLKKGPAKYLVQRLRDEAHRFARKYHHKLVEQSYFK
jgi:excinuclease ABC subunit C